MTDAPQIMKPNQPDGSGEWYKQWLNEDGTPDGDWAVVLLMADKDGRLRHYGIGLDGYIYAEEETNTYWERCPAPWWAKAHR